MAQKNETQETKEKPLFERQFGNVHAAVWLNQHKDTGALWFNSKFVRRYHDGSGWQETTSYSRDDLPVLIIAACSAYFWIWTQLSTARRDQKAAA